MNQNKQAPRRRMTRREWRIRRCLRLARNWAVFLAACGAAVALMTSGILWLLPKAHALIAGPEDFVARNYDGTEYQLNLADARLVLVNGSCGGRRHHAGTGDGLSGCFRTGSGL